MPKRESQAPQQKGTPSVRPKHLPLALSRSVAPPQLVPARMINEVMYCERLLHLEWSQKEWADNKFTVEGRLVHRRADKSGGALPPKRGKSVAKASESAEDDRPYKARSVWLESEALGITSKIDVVESSDGRSVVPVEYKRGKAPDLPEGAYKPELVQVCAQVLLLRDHGYECHEGAIYFAASKQRVTIEVTSDLIGWTRWAVKLAREVAARATPPPPLEDDPKCQGCSLVAICLPDETNLLRRLNGEDELDTAEVVHDGGLTGPLDPDPWDLSGEIDGAESAPAKSKLRQLVPARDDRVPVYVQDPRSQIRVAGQRLVISGKDGASHARLMDTSQLSLYGNPQITTQAVRALLERGIPVSLHSGGGWFLGRISGAESKNVELRVAQYGVAADAERCLLLARGMIEAKIKNCRTLLRRNARNVDPVDLGQLKQLARKVTTVGSLASLLGLEGAAARCYFQSFSKMLKGDNAAGFDFERRNRRPPTDPVNALLSFAYSLLTREFTHVLANVGLDPQLGFYHQPRFGRPALALDMMEEFRPLIADSVVIGLINRGELTSGCFVSVAGACNLTPAGRKKFIEGYERRMDQLITHPVFGYKISYRRVLEVQARLLSRMLTGELDFYPSFRTR